MSQLARAGVFDGPGMPFELREFPLPKLSRGEVLVKVTCCTICGSDLHTYLGRRTTPCPTILGHEILGTVAALPDDQPVHDLGGKPLQLRQRVTWSLAASCGACFFCEHAIPQKCERLFKYGHEPLTPLHPFSGGLAEFCHLAPGTAILPVPDALGDSVACPANCATATVAAALRTAGRLRDRAVLVQGAGMLGLTAAAMASEQGASQIIMCDVNSDRLQLAKEFGARVCINVANETTDLRKCVDRATNGRGVDVALELCGAPAAMEQAVDLLRIGGTYVVAGAVFPARPVSLSAETIVRKLLTIRGVHNYQPPDLAAALEFLTQSHRRFPFAKLVSAHFSLTQAVDAFDHAVESGALRVAVTP